MVAWFAARQALADPIRPFNPARDLAGLASLIEVAFGDELALTGSRVVQDMRQIALLGPMLRVTQPLLSMFSGYVWVEDGRLVGNVTLSPEREPLTWSISNVAVLPAFRGRGIAHRLMERALEHVRREGGCRVLLQVRSDNAVALGLYERLGFATYDTLWEYGLPEDHWPVDRAAPRLGLRPARVTDWRRVYSLVLASTSLAMLEHRPLHVSDYRRGVLWRLHQWLQLALGAPDQLEMVADVRGQLLAYGALSVTQSQGAHVLKLAALPEARGHWELALIESLLGQIAEGPRHAVQCHLSVNYPQGAAALELAGFRLLRTLAQMSLDARGSRAAFGKEAR